MKAFAYAGEWYNFMLTVDGFNGATTQRVTVRHVCSLGPACSSENNSIAYWDEAQNLAVVTNGYAAPGHHRPRADAPAHRAHLGAVWLHAGSGALAEHFADVFGEALDQAVTSPTLPDSDTTTGNVFSHTLNKGHRWYIGEDATTPLRNMQDPSVYGDPKTMGDANYQCSPTVDNGGIHSNNGVPNRAFQMMVDGNASPAVTAIGMTKALAIESYTLSTYMLSGSDFTEYMNSMKSACSFLIGTAGISLTDCDRVEDALDAVGLTGNEVIPYLPVAAAGHSGLLPGGQDDQPLDDGYLRQRPRRVDDARSHVGRHQQLRDERNLEPLWSGAGHGDQRRCASGADDNARGGWQGPVQPRLRLRE